jgi:hypothetical protein
MAAHARFNLKSEEQPLAGMRRAGTQVDVPPTPLRRSGHGLAEIRRHGNCPWPWMTHFLVQNDGVTERLRQEMKDPHFLILHSGWAGYESA